MKDNISDGRRLAFLRGRRVDLRPLLRSDVPTLMRWINDPDVWHFLGLTRPNSERTEEEWVDGQCKDPAKIVFVIQTKRGVPIGTMGMHNIDWISRTAETGAPIGEKRFWSRGYGSDAKMALLAYAFDTLNLRKLYSKAFAFNGRSIAYSKKCGYRVEARLKGAKYRDGRYQDDVILSVSKRDFNRVRRTRTR